jgi:CheY-like chemotaxis protein
MNRRLRIVVADDEESLRVAAREILVAAGYHVEAVRDGAELMRVYRAKPADVVLCDIFMPGKEGLETIRDLRREFPDAKIIAMTGGGHAGTFDVLELARLLGAVELLRKPFGHAKLLAAVDRVLTR